MGSNYDANLKISKGGTTSTIPAVEKNYDRGRTISSVVFASQHAEDSQKPRGTETQAQAVVRSRKHPTLAARECQLNVNVLGLRGGRPYVDRRLARFPGEPELMWSGGEANSQWIEGRRDQTHVLPYLSRIAEKINQYIFGQGVERKGADEDIIRDINRAGEHVNRLMRDASSLVTACGWCWVGVDMPAVTNDTTLGDVQAGKIRAYWNLYDAMDIVDWSYDDLGNLEWVLVETVITKTGAATEPRMNQKVRVLWDAENVTIYKYKVDRGVCKDEIAGEEVIRHGFGLCPFVMVGSASPLPHIFDSLEGVNKTIMDLQSANRQNFFEGVFPRMYFPASMFDRWMEQSVQGGKPSGVGMAIGMHDPTFVGENEQPPGIVATNASDFEAMRRETEYLKYELFETAGLLLKQESRAAQSAESKAFDNLEIEQGLRDRAQLLQEAEEKAIAISVAIDPNFKAYEPIYPTQFSVRDFVEELKAYVLVGNMMLPDGVNKLVLRKVTETLAKMGVQSTDEEIKAIMEEIENAESGGGQIVPAVAIEEGEQTE